MRGIITKGIGGLYTVVSDQNSYECTVRGKFRLKDNLTPVVGDSVEISCVGDNDYTISEIYERKSLLIRPKVANVDQLIITFAAKKPKPDLLLIDKLTVESVLQKINVIICITKADLSEASYYEKIYKKAGFSVVVTGFGLSSGLDELSEFTEGRISALAGCSGVGKSTLINSIEKGKDLQTGEISKKIERGRHTTRHVELIRLKNGGYIFDTPGFSSFEISDADRLSDCFREFSGFLPCRFSDCTHISEPHCNIRKAFEEGRIPETRYKNYVILYDELKRREKYR